MMDKPTPDEFADEIENMWADIGEWMKSELETLTADKFRREYRQEFLPEWDVTPKE